MAQVLSTSNAGWLHSARFDALLIGGVLALALGLGAVAMQSPGAFAVVLLADLWLLAYPHVASTFTRVAFDRPSRGEHRLLLFGAPLMVLASTSVVGLLGGAYLLNTVYFYWQSYHYTKQSYGIARAYGHVSGTLGPAAPRDSLTDFVVFAFPVWGVLRRAAQHPTAFYGTPFWTPPIPDGLVTLAGAAAVAALVLWVARQARLLLHGQAGFAGALPPTANQPLGLTLYVLTHVAVTATSYLWVTEITSGWLFVNIWHNAQYLLFVWAANTRRFQAGMDPSRLFLSWICQPQRVWVYAAFVLGLSSAFYWALGRASAQLPQHVVPFYLVCHQAVNFYHYVVDAMIWRRKRA